MNKLLAAIATVQLLIFSNLVVACSPKAKTVERTICHCSAALVYHKYKPTLVTMIVVVQATCDDGKKQLFQSKAVDVDPITAKKEKMAETLVDMCSEVKDKMAKARIEASVSKMLENMEIVNDSEDKASDKAPEKDIFSRVYYISPIQPTRPPEGDSGDEE